MTSKEFVIWLKGFTEGVHEFNVTPKQWDHLKDTLNSVSDEVRGYSITFNSGSANTAISYPANTTWYYTNGENAKQQLND